ncbi:MAG: polymer-forming cytoskeletal protein [Bryobacteraceae bacterium]|jgi:cytoskeletal protein CcmA (bactofilin family)
MWNKKKEEEYPPKQGASQAPPSYGTREGVSNVSTSAAPAFHAPEPVRNSAIIGKSVSIKGNIFSQEDLTIEGEVEGSVELKENRLTVGPNGRVQAGVKAREIVVLGSINGNVEATEKIDIRKEARLVGDIKTSRIVIEDGAYFKGSIDIVRPNENAKPAPKQQSQTAPQPAAQPAPQSAQAQLPQVAAQNTSK